MISVLDAFLTLRADAVVPGKLAEFSKPYSSLELRSCFAVLVGLAFRSSRKNPAWLVRVFSPLRLSL